MSYNHLVFMLLTASLLPSCLDPIELNVPKGGVTDIAIDGKLVYGNPSSFQVSISELFDFDGIPNRISVRYVELVDDTGNGTRIRSQDNGVYTKQIFDDDPDISIEPGNQYKLRILLANGEMVESDFQSLKRVPRNNKIRQEAFRKLIEQDDGQLVDRPAIRFIAENQVPEDNGTKLKIDVTRTFKFSNLDIFPTPNGTGFCQTAIATRVDRICDLLRDEPDHPAGLFDCDNGGVTNAVECDRGTNPIDSLDDGDPTIITRSCYISGFENIRNLKLFDPSKDQSGNSVFTQDLFEPTFDFKFAEGYYIQVITETLNQAVYDYFEKIEEVISLSGSMFDPPAGRIQGNITNLTNDESTVYGYFYFTEQDTTSQFVERNLDIQDFFCLRDFRGPPPETCMDCTAWEREGESVTIFRPSFWPSN